VGFDGNKENRQVTGLYLEITSLLGVATNYGIVCDDKRGIMTKRRVGFVVLR